MKKFLISTIVALSLVVGLFGIANAQDTTTVTVTGSAFLRADRAHSRDEAIQDAQRKAVEQAVGAMVDSETLVENFMTISDTIYVKSSGYIRSYKIIKESADEKDLTYDVTIQAVVANGAIEDDLRAIGIVIGGKGKPRTMLMIAEQNLGNPNKFHGWWARGQGADVGIVEAIIFDEMLDMGFPMVDHAIAAGKFKATKAVGGKEPNDNYAVQVGKAFDAEVVIIGKALVNASPYRKGFSAQSTITLRAVDVDTGNVIASASINGKAWHINEIQGGTFALQKAARKIADAITTKIIKRWRSDIHGGARIKVKLKGIRGMKHLRRIKAVIKDMRGVSAIYQRDYRKGSAVLEVDYKGKAEDLAIALEDNQAGLNISIIGITQNTINARVR